MKKEKKLSKKASAKVWSVASKFKPGISKNTSYDEAWEIIATEGDLEGDLEANKYGLTKFTLYRGEEVLHIYDLGVVIKDGEWDWNTIYKTVCEDIVARRLYKKPKLGKRAQKKKDEEVAKVAQERKEKDLLEEQQMLKEQQKQSKPEVSKDELKRLKFNLKMKIKNWEKKGKDVSGLNKELSELETKLKSNKQTNQISSRKHDFPAISKEISKKIEKVSEEKKSSEKSKENKTSNNQKTTKSKKNSQKSLE